eukprot:TRINITY_DN31999_c0_g1_i1.p1 TRINITY_DN31999_c0_g1~~TRINITY_DN31999_c0_g1_i1.p1  ORF type:complete len:409 (+),score=59.07 TRINITY_DN31999_c0_g1_i1:135-1361(+)
MFGFVSTLVMMVAAYNNGAPYSRLPPMGWSSWVALGPNGSHPIFDYCDETSVMDAVNAFMSVGLYDAGYRHFHLDDCWAYTRNSSGYLVPDPSRFPNGMKIVVDHAHSKGLAFGIYTCAGNQTCAGRRPGSRDHWKQDADLFAEWGVDWVKMDWCDTEGMNPVDTYSNMSKALNSTGRPIHFNMCEWGHAEPWKWGPRVAQSWRITSDHEATWDSTVHTITKSAEIPSNYTGSPYSWNDMDMLQTGNYEQAAHPVKSHPNMTATEYKSAFSMWAINASPLMITTPIMNCSTGTCIPGITDLQKEILFNEEVISINQDITPQGRPIKRGSNVTAATWTRELSDGSVAVALFNEYDDVVNGGFLLTEIGLGGPAVVRDLWLKKDIGTFNVSYGPVSVSPHETKVLKVHRL